MFLNIFLFYKTLENDLKKLFKKLFFRTFFKNNYQTSLIAWFLLFFIHISNINLTCSFS